MKSKITNNIQITGTLISYYFICKTKLWLHANRINLEDNSEDVRIGKVLHEIKEEDSKNAEIKIDNIKIDKITKEYLIEYKKSDSDLEAIRWQVLLYLYKLKQKEIIRKGKVELFEQNRQSKKTHIIELDSQSETELLMILDEIEKMIEAPTPPPVILDNKCKRCAYYEYCFI